MIWILPLLGLILVESIADIFSKEYSLKGGWYWAAAILCYILANSFWLYSIRHGAGLARGAIIFSVSSAILAVFIGLHLYNEKIGHHQYIGIVLGITALVFLFSE